MKVARMTIEYQSIFEADVSQSISTSGLFAAVLINLSYVACIV